MNEKSKEIIKKQQFILFSFSFLNKNNNKMEKIETSRDLEETQPDQTSETGLSLRILYPLLKTSFKCLQLLS